MIIKYPKKLITKDLTIIEESVLYTHLSKNMAFKDMLKILRGSKYMFYKKAINKIQKYLNNTKEHILLDERYFALKHRNSRRLYKLYLLLNKPPYMSIDDLKLLNIPFYKYQSYNRRNLQKSLKELEKVYDLHFDITNYGIITYPASFVFMEHVKAVYLERFRVPPLISDKDKNDIIKLLDIYSLDQLKKYYTYYIFNKNSLNFSNFGMQKFIKNIGTISAAAEVAEDYHFVWINELKNICDEVYDDTINTSFGLDGNKIYFTCKPYIDENNHLVVTFVKVGKDGKECLYNAEGNIMFLKNLFAGYKQIKENKPDKFFLKVVK